MLEIISIFLNLPRLDLWPRMWSILQKIPCALEKKVKFIVLGWNVLRRSLEGCSHWGRWGSDTTEWLHFHFSLSCIGEGNGNSLQCSCLENPRDRGAWWAAIYGVAQSRSRLKRLSRSSSRWLDVSGSWLWLSAGFFCSFCLVSWDYTPL